MFLLCIRSYMNVTEWNFFVQAELIVYIPPHIYTSNDLLSVSVFVSSVLRRQIRALALPWMLPITVSW